jgi:hypothetical protein
MRGYFGLWAGVLSEKDHPELFRLQIDGRTRDRKVDAEAATAANRQLLEVVRELSRRKTGVAAEITAATIRQVERELSKP